MGASGSRHRQVHLEDGLAAIAGDNQPRVLGDQSGPNGRPEPSQATRCQTRVELFDGRKRIGKSGLVAGGTAHVGPRVIPATVDAHDCAAKWLARL